MSDEYSYWTNIHGWWKCWGCDRDPEIMRQMINHWAKYTDNAWCIVRNSDGVIIAEKKVSHDRQ